MSGPYYTYHTFNVLFLLRRGNLSADSAAGPVPCGGPKRSPSTLFKLQIIFFFRSFGTGENIQSIQTIHV